MAVNKNFVVKNGLEVNTNLLVADLDTQTVGIGTTISPHELHVVGGIGVTNLLVTGVATIGNLRVTGPSTFIGVSTFVDGNVHIQKSLFVNGINITGGSGGSIGTDLHIQRHVRAGGIVTFSDSLFVGSGLGQSTGTVGQVFQVAGVSSDAYIGGTLGIGTTNPQDLALHVVGDTRFVGVNTFQGDIVVTGNLDVTGDITYDEITGRNLNISGLATFQSLTQNRVAIVGAGDTLNDTNDLRFADNDLSQLVLGVGATVGGGLTASSVMVEDLTDNRVVLAGTGGELEDSGNLTFDGTQLVVTGVATVSGAMTAGSFSVGNNQVISSARQLQNIASLDSTTTATIESAIANAPNTFTDIEVTGIATFKSTVKVEDLAPNRVVFVGAGDSLTDDTNFTFDRSQLILGVGATVGGALTVAGEGTFASTVGIAESIFHIGDTNTSFGFPAADTFTVDTAGEERLRVASDGAITVSNDGTDADGANLTLKHINNNTTDVVSSLIFSNNVGEVARIQGETSGANNSGLISLYTDNAGTSAERLRITSDGDVGIGTDDPQGVLHLLASDAKLIIQDSDSSGNSGTPRIQFQDSSGAPAHGEIGYTGTGDSDLSIINKENANIQLHTNNTERLRITGIGSVGIGTVAPEHAFVVRDDGLARIRIRNDSNAADSFASFNLKTRNGEWSMYADGSSGSDDYLKIFRQGSGTHLYFYESIDKIGINSAICQVDANGNTLGDSKFGFFTSETNTGFHVQTNGERTLKVNDDGLISSGIVTASGGFDLGIHSAGTSVVSGPIKILNFVGTGNTFAYNASTDTIDISIAGGSGGGSGVTETDTTVSTTNPTGVGSFATASFRSASVIAQINQLNTDFQVGRYLMIHDGTTVTVVEESAVSTGSTMLGSFTGVIDGSNVELRVTLASAGVSTVTTKIDTVTV